MKIALIKTLGVALAVTGLEIASGTLISADEHAQFAPVVIANTPNEAASELQTIDVNVPTVAERYGEMNQAPAEVRINDQYTADIETLRCAEARDKVLSELIEPLTSLTASTKNSAGLKPKCPPVAQQYAMIESEPSQSVGVHWRAAELRHRPLYFEDINLERYGHKVVAQPVVSAVKFIGNKVLLPVKMIIDKPYECKTDLGLKRPGDLTGPVNCNLAGKN